MGILLWPEGRAIAPRQITPSQTIEDLQLEAICNAMTFNHYWRLSVQDLEKLWTDDPSIIEYRQQVLGDFLENPALEPLLEQLLDSIDSWESHSRHASRGSEDRNRALDLWDFSFLDSFLKKMESLNQELGRMNLKSSGMLAFRETIGKLCRTPRFRAVRETFEADCGGYEYPSRITIGFNLSDQLKPVSLKLLRVPQKAEKGRCMSLTPSAMMTARQVLSKAISDAGASIGGFVRQENGPLRAVKQDIIFYLSALHLRKSWENQSLASCFPDIRPVEEKAFCTKGMFNPLLVIHGEDQIVANEIEFTKGGELLILTGANQGGKTVFLLSVALTQWLFQLGIMVPCASAALSPAEQVLTVFAPTVAGASAVRDRGLLAQEAGRVAEAVRGLSKNSLILLNEPLNATSPMENLYISREILAAIKVAGARGVWVTHLYELASDRERLNGLLPWGSKLGSIRAVVETDESGTHSTYRVTRGEPEFNSFAAEVMRRKGLEYT